MLTETNGLLCVCVRLATVNQWGTISWIPGSDSQFSLNNYNGPDCNFAQMYSSTSHIGSPPCTSTFAPSTGAITGSVSVSCVNQCATVSCGSHGTCGAGGVCICAAGYTGTYCTTVAPIPKSASSSTGSAVAPAGSGYDPTVWLGSYSAHFCDSRQCCCASTVDITRTTGGSAGTYLVTGSQLTGSCPSGVTSISATIPVPTSNSITYTLAAQAHTATFRPSTRSIVDINNAAEACSATLANKANNTPTNSAGVTRYGVATVPLMMLSALGAIVAATRCT